MLSKANSELKKRELEREWQNKYCWQKVKLGNHDQKDRMDATDGNLVVAILSFPVPG